MKKNESPSRVFLTKATNIPQAHLSSTKHESPLELRLSSRSCSDLNQLAKETISQNYGTGTCKRFNKDSLNLVNDTSIDGIVPVKLLLCSDKYAADCVPEQEKQYEDLRWPNETARGTTIDSLMSVNVAISVGMGPVNMLLLSNNCSVDYKIRLVRSTIQPFKAMDGSTTHPSCENLRSPKVQCLPIYYIPGPSIL